MKNTAVEWMYEQLCKNPKDNLLWPAILNVAKQQEKLQITKSLLDGKEMVLDLLEDITMEEYYQETYGNK
jgi:hypothetical protein